MKKENLAIYLILKDAIYMFLAFGISFAPDRVQKIKIYGCFHMFFLFQLRETILNALAHIRES